MTITRQPKQGCRAFFMKRGGQMSYSLHISPGNRKMGAIPSFSLPSGESCSKAACATCYKSCYFRRHVERRYKAARQNCQENFIFAKKDPRGLERALNWYFDNPSAPRLFRIHVGGDFYSKAYFELWLRVVRKHPQTRFLAFTKQFDTIAPYVSRLPKNFALVLSAWPGSPLPDNLARKLPVAWMQDGTEDRVPPDAISCGGQCASCGRCWTLDGRHVVFQKH